MKENFQSFLVKGKVYIKYCDIDNSLYKHQINILQSETLPSVSCHKLCQILYSGAHYRCFRYPPQLQVFKWPTQLCLMFTGLNYGTRRYLGPLTSLLIHRLITWAIWLLAHPCRFLWWPENV